jgi:Protein of unknown function, DUF547
MSEAKRPAPAARAAALMLALGCAEKIEVEGADLTQDRAVEWAALLSESSGPEGLDYEKIAAHREVLQGYLAYAAVTGAFSSGWKESQEDKRMAHFLNTYNAAVIEAVLRRWPIQSVDEVRLKPWSSFTEASFFWGQDIQVDGEWVSLYHLRSHYIINRFQEPLVHITLNSGYRSDPPVVWWESTGLQRQMEREMRAWLRTDAALRKTEDGWAIHELFFQNQDDFLDWSTTSNLCGWLSRYTVGEVRAWMASHQRDCRLTRIPSDRSLNSRDPAKAPNIRDAQGVEAVEAAPEAPSQGEPEDSGNP